MKEFTENIEKLGLVSKDKLVLGVSGGIDSVVMLNLFYNAGFKNIIVAHLNHGVRKEADNDEKFVEKLAIRYEYSFESKRINPPKKGNLENQLRESRREYLLEIVRKNDADFLLLGHNKNDQVETFILNLVRGSGVAGLAGMGAKEGITIRPMVNISRDIIEKYANDHKLEWHEDLSNQDTSFKRNFVRHKILPLFAEINPEYLENIFRTGEIQAEIDKKLKSDASKFLVCDTTTLQQLEKPILFEVIATKYEIAKGNRKELNFKNFRDLQKLIQSTDGTKEVDLPEGFKAVRKYKSLEIVLKKEDNEYSQDAEIYLKIGKTEFDGWEFEATEMNEFIKDESKSSLSIDSDEFKKLKTRNWATGDKIKKEGILGSVKIQDIFTNAKIDKDKRKHWPIVLNANNEIVWVPNLSFSRFTKPKTNKIIKITARKADNEK